MSRSDALDAAIDATDLPALIAELYPDSRAKPGTTDVIFASWRGNTNSPAVSVNRKGRRWLWSDKASGEGGNAFHFLTGPGNLTPQEAAHALMERAGIAHESPDEEPAAPRFRAIPQDAYGALSASHERPPPASMKGRGFTASMLLAYGIVAAEDAPNDALIPITSPDGVVLQVKRRLAQATDKGKYRYEHSGYGGPPWCSVGSRDAQEIYIVEGELNAIIAHAALTQAGEVGFGVMGIAGSDNALYDGLCQGKHVFIYSDDDKAGAKARDKWAAKAREDGARSVHVLPGQAADFCDYAGTHGRPALAELIKDLRRSAKQVFGAMDRMVGAYSVRDLAESAKRYISGKIINPTGIHSIDVETGGIREAGVFGVGGLSSMGKSAFMRRILVEHVRKGGTVRVYSPDQSPQAIYRLLASMLSGVGPREVRTRELLAPTLHLYHDDPDAAVKGWQQAYEHVILNLAPRFQISEESELREISKDMERAVDQGVTMFGVDFLQLLEPEGRDTKDGVAAKQLQKVSMSLGKPVVAAIQLAKYKFPVGRHSGIPVLTDIEGSGAYMQSCEMIFMVYNERIYRAKYAGADYDAIGDEPGHARIYLRKDKEGGGDMEFQCAWVPHLVTFKDYSRMRLAEEREGLM